MVVPVALPPVVVQGGTLAGVGETGVGMPVDGGRTTGSPGVGAGVTSLIGYGSAIGWFAGGRSGSGVVGCDGVSVGVGVGVGVAGVLVGGKTGLDVVGIPGSGVRVGSGAIGCDTGVATGCGAGAGAGAGVVGAGVTVTGFVGACCAGRAGRAARLGAPTRGIVRGRPRAGGRIPDDRAGLAAGSGAASTEVTSGAPVPMRGVGTLSKRPSKSEKPKTPATAPASKIAVKNRSIPSCSRDRLPKTSLESGREGVVCG